MEASVAALSTKKVHTNNIVPEEQFPDSAFPPYLAVDCKKVCIRNVDADSHRHSATVLINRMYTRRGYAAPGIQEHPQRISLVACDKDVTIGTLTLGLESEAGLLVDEIYKDEVDQYRERGRSVCELTKLALDTAADSKQMLASLFHIAYIYGRILNEVTDVLIEVNPRHVAFYKRMLGFKQVADQRLCPRVNAPAVLLGLELEYVDQKIIEFGGQPANASVTKSLYPYFFSKKEESGIVNRIKKLS